MPTKSFYHQARSQPRRSNWILTLIVLVFLSISSRPNASANAAQYQAWSERPLLAYFVFTPSLQIRLQREAELSAAEWRDVRSAALYEADALGRLRVASERITADPGLSLDRKRAAIRQMGYNRRVTTIAYATAAGLHRALPPPVYARLAAWVERAWREEVQSHRLAAELPASSNLNWIAGLRRGWDFSFSRLMLSAAPLPAPRSFEIYATRYDSRGRYTAALPDQCLKLTNGGLKSCVDKGYIVGQTYSIIMNYKKSVGVDVAEAGPWNIDDNFWATLGDPTPRRMFADLPLGMPEAQAAFYNGYNGGQDQYGRKVTAPFAIDLAFEVADDLGLPPRMNDWITVSMMWTEGWDGGAGSGHPESGVSARVAPVETVPPAADGSIVHTVQTGQALWSIAAAYGVNLGRLLELNGLSETSVIIPGQKLIVHLAGETASPVQPSSGTSAAEEPSPTPGASIRRTQKATRKTAAAETPTPEKTPSAAQLIESAVPVAAAQSSPPAAGTAREASTPRRLDPLPMAIGAAALLGLALIAWGLLASRR